MALLVKGIASVPQLFQPRVGAAGGDPKFQLTLLLPPTDPQLQTIYQEVQTAIQNGFPQGMRPNQTVCFMPYDEKYRGKDYYDQRFSGWWALSLSAPQDNKPAVVDMNRQPVIDPSMVYSGCVVYASCGISAFTKGNGGIGGWLNGVMVTGEMGDMGRLDGRPTVDQMFSNAPTGGPGLPAAPGMPPMPGAPAPAPNMMAPPAAPGAPSFNTAPPAAPGAQTFAPPVAPAPPAAPAAPPAAPAGPQMTAKAGGATYESFKKSGWTDEAMIQQGYMLPPGGQQFAFNQ